MSRVPMMSDGGAWAIDPQVAYHTHFVPQGISADLIATLYGISREDADRYALASQQRAAHAWSNGYFDRSVIPILDHVGNVVLDHDETVRTDATLESLADLNPAFAKVFGWTLEELEGRTRSRAGGFLGVGENPRVSKTADLLNGADEFDSRPDRRSQSRVALPVVDGDILHVRFNL